MFLKRYFNNITNSTTRVVILLFLVSLIAHFILWAVVINADVTPRGDEAAYFYTATGYAEILRDLSHLQLPSNETLALAYGMGLFPPFNSLLLSLGLIIFGQKVAVARFIIVIISSLTTPLVYLLTRKLSTNRAAVISSIIHIFYPVFLAYSHYLWSETTYIFLLLLSIYCIVLLCDEQNYRRRIFYAILAGMFLGFCGLTRPAVLPFLFIVPLWLVFVIKDSRLRLILPFAVVFTCILILLPWQTALIVKEKRFVLLSTNTGRYMYFGNNPWVPKGIGTSEYDPGKMTLMHNATKEYSESNSVAWGEAQLALGLHEIKSNFKQFLSRCIDRLQLFLTSDFLPIRHIVAVSYPPLSNNFIIILWCLVVISYIIFCGLAAWGILDNYNPMPKRSLIIIMVAAGIIPPIITVATPRLHLPLLALLLPAAGHGFISIKHRLSRYRKLTVTGILLILCLLIFNTFPQVISTFLTPSSYYSPLFIKLDHVLGIHTSFTDYVFLRASDTDNTGQLNIAIHSKGSMFRPLNAKVYRWEPTPENNQVQLEISSSMAGERMELFIDAKKIGQSSIIQPIKKLSWRKWQPSGMNGIEYMWSSKIEE